MISLGHFLKNHLLISKKDFGILSAIFILVFATSFIFLWANSAFIDRLHLTMQVLAVIIFILLGLNVSFLIFRLISNTDKIIPMIQHLQSTGVLKKTVTELIILNIIALANFACLTLSYVVDDQRIQILIVSTSVASWPLFFLVLMNMEGIITSSENCYSCKPNEFGGMAVAENCGPAVVPSSEHFGFKPGLDRRKNNRDEVIC